MFKNLLGTVVLNFRGIEFLNSKSSEISNGLGAYLDLLLSFLLLEEREFEPVLILGD